MTTPHEDTFIGPQRQPSEEELAAQLTVRIPWQHQPAPSRRQSHAPLAVTVAVGTGLAALISLAAVLVLVVLGQVTLGRKPDGGAVVIAVAGWLLAHGVPLQTPSVYVGLAPLSVTLLALWRLNRAGVHATRGIGARGSGSVRQALFVALSIGSGYSVIGAAAAIVIDSPGLTVSVGRAALHLFVCGTVAGLVGALRATGAVRSIARRTPQLLRDGLRTGVVGCFLLIGAGAGAGGLAIALNGGEAVQLFGTFPSGVAGQAGVTVICLAFAPNMALWATSYLAGAGFVIGPGVIISAGTVTLAAAEPGQPQALPPLPAFAGLPSSALHGLAWMMMAIPVLAGLTASMLLVRRRLRARRTRSGDMVLPDPRWMRMFGSAALAGPVAGLLIAAATYAGSGKLDGGGPFPIGAVPWQAGAGAMLAITLGACLGVAGAFLRQQLVSRPE